MAFQWLADLLPELETERREGIFLQPGIRNPNKTLQPKSYEVSHTGLIIFAGVGFIRGHKKKPQTQQFQSTALPRAKTEG